MIYLGNQEVYPMLRPGMEVNINIRLPGEKVYREVRGRAREKQYNNHPMRYYIILFSRPEWIRDREEYEVIITW